MPVDPSQADRVHAQIEKVYGKGVVHAGDETPALKRISTGNIELDIATGGGIPMGRWCHLWGGYSSGKSLTCWQIAREAMALGMGVCYYNIEKQYHPDFVVKQGVDVSSPLFKIVEAATIEAVGTMMESLMKAYHIHIIDSLANATSIDMLNAKVEDWQMGLNARAWGKVLARIHERLDLTDNAIIMVNQARDSFGQQEGEHPPGGRLIDFVSSMTVYFRRTKWLHRREDGVLDPEAAPRPTLSGQNEPEGIEFRLRVEKSRVSRPFRTAVLRYDFATGHWDELWSLAKGAGFHQVIERSGSWYTMPDGKRVQGELKLRNALAGDEELQRHIRKVMLEAA